MDSEATVQFDTLLPHRLGTAAKPPDHSRLVDGNGYKRSGNLILEKLAGRLRLFNDCGSITGNPEVYVSPLTPTFVQKSAWGKRSSWNGDSAKFLEERLWIASGWPTIHSETTLPPQLRRACAALRRYSLGAIPKTRLKALLNAASES
jgi:hypothetical protein